MNRLGLINRLQSVRLRMTIKHSNNNYNQKQDDGEDRPSL